MGSGPCGSESGDKFTYFTQFFW
ncbi:hypothetical protein NC653_035766 [Populus alba x Populus x berolinensis]|uniref:Uncharacterized protein n=1 Tax=Populus alba x Populus x berolinensis TaxID=444605 RepID=A0AAD6PVL9_9ROSI|nr:hypothetical protein NC653_035766 [Populus alba x Populus x berolinensis]